MDLPRLIAQADQMTGHAIDHPVTFPEGEYLKAVIARVPQPERPGRS